MSDYCPSRELNPGRQGCSLVTVQTVLSLWTILPSAFSLGKEPQQKIRTRWSSWTVVKETRLGVCNPEKKSLSSSFEIVGGASSNLFIWKFIYFQALKKSDTILSTKRVIYWPNFVTRYITLSEKHNHWNVLSVTSCSRPASQNLPTFSLSPTSCVETLLAHIQGDSSSAWSFAHRHSCLHGCCHKSCRLVLRITCRWMTSESISFHTNSTIFKGIRSFILKWRFFFIVS
jgi:hypothetical protein